MQRSLLDQLIELTKLDYPDDYVRFGHLACAIEGEALPDEAARKRFRAYGRYDLAAFSSRPANEVSESMALRKKFVEHFANVFRDQMVGRVKGSLEVKPLEPVLIKPGALRFDPDELVLDKGNLTIVDVRVEPAPVVDAPVAVVSVEKPPAVARNRGGAAPIADWEMVDQEVFRLMDENGEFIDADPQWNAQARLEKAISDYCETAFHTRPGENTVRTHVRNALKLWRQRRTEI
jgi:hypothetical protein